MGSLGDELSFLGDGLARLQLGLERGQLGIDVLTGPEAGQQVARPSGTLRGAAIDVRRERRIRLRRGHDLLERDGLRRELLHREHDGLLERDRLLERNGLLDELVRRGDGLQIRLDRDVLDRLGGLALGIGRRWRVAGEERQPGRGIELRLVVDRPIGLGEPVLEVLMRAVRGGEASEAQVGGDARQIDLGPGLHLDRGGLEGDGLRERRLKDLVAEVRGAAQAVALGGVPAIAARVLAARHAEVERGVEGVELLRGGLALLVAARGGHRLVERRVVAHHPVLHASAEGLELAELLGLARRDRLERVAGSAALAEGLGEDLGHAAPETR